MKLYLYKLSQGLLLLSMLFLAFSCTEEEEEMEFTPGDELFVMGSSSVYAGAEGVRYYVDNNILDKDYSWSITGGATIQEDPDNDGFVYIDFTDPGTYELTVSNGETQGSLTIEVSSKVVSLGATKGEGMEYNGDENDTIRIPIAITDPTFESANPTTAVTTIYYVIEGTATEGDDYELLSDNPLVLPAGFDADTTINIKLLDDAMLESDDSIVVRITSVSSEDASDMSVVLTDSTEITQFVFQIMDDFKYVSFEESSVDTLTSAYDAGDYSFHVQLSSPAQADVTIPYTISGTGVLPTSGELLFKKGTTSQPLLIRLLDGAFMSDQDVTITLEDPISSDEEVVFNTNEDNNVVGNQLVLPIYLED